MLLPRQKTGSMTPALYKLLPTVSLALLLALGVTACGGGSGGSEQPAPTESSDDNEPETDSDADTDSGTDNDAQEPNDLSEAESFTNPLFQNGADPWLEYYQGNYYLTTTTWSSQLVMRKSPTLAGLAEAKPHYIWSDTDPDRCCNFWAFEFHRLEGPNGPRWYVMYTAGVEGDLGGQRLHVLESAGDDPLGPYEFKNTLMPNRWNIDGTYLEHNDKLYVIWSEWSGPDQSGWIAEMENPWTVVEGTQTLISRPTYDWEKGADLNGNPGRVNEGQAILKHEGRTFMSFSASSCHGPNYKIGVMELIGADPLNPEDWHKYPEPFLQAGNGVYGPGHNGFFQSPDGTEDWLVYHGNELATQGCSADRWVRAQPIDWTPEGLPDLGEPAGPDTRVPNPSGEDGPISARVQGADLRLISRHSGHCLGLDDEGNAVQVDCAQQESGWVLDAAGGDHYRLAHVGTEAFLSDAECLAEDQEGMAAEPWFNSACQQWQLSRADGGWYEIHNRDSGRTLALDGCAAETGSAVGAAPEEGNSLCQQWRLEPVGDLTLANENSGRLLEVAGCSQESGANVAQWQMTGADCQRWGFEHTSEGHYQLHPQHNPQACLAVENASAEAGGNMLQNACEGSSAEWRVDPLGDGTWRLSPRHAPDLALDIASCGLADGTNLGQWEWLDNDCQRFRLGL